MAVADADDVYLPERLAKQVAFLEGHAEIAVVGGTMLIMGQDGGTDFECATVFRRGRGGFGGGCCGIAAYRHSAAMVRMEAVRSVGGYRPIFRMSSDHDFVAENK